MNISDLTKAQISKLASRWNIKFTSKTTKAQMLHTLNAFLIDRLNKYGPMDKRTAAQARTTRKFYKRLNAYVQKASQS